MKEQLLSSLVRFSTWLVTALLVSACGGGDSGGFIGGGGTSTEGIGTSSYTLSIRTFAPDGSESREFSVEQPLKVVVTLSGGDDIVGQRIEITSSIGNVEPENGSSLTDSNGSAEFLLSADEAIGAGEITATFTSSSGQVTAVFAVETVAAAGLEGYTLSMVSSGGDLSVNNMLSLTVTLTTAEGDPVVGEEVSVTTSIGLLERPSGLTDRDGRVEFLLTYDAAGAGEVIATFDGSNSTYSASVKVNAIDEPLATYQLTVEKLTEGDLTTDNPLLFAIRLTDALGQGVGDEIVKLSVTNGEINQTSVLTDSTGAATVEVAYSGEPGAGTLTATYVVQAGAFNSSVNFRSLETEDQKTLTFVRLVDTEGNPATSFSSTQPLTAVVELRENGVIPDGPRPITLSLSGVAGRLLPDNGIALTNVDTGQATFAILYDGQTGAGELLATYAGPTENEQVSTLISAEVADLDLGSFTDQGAYTDALIRALPSPSVSYSGAVELLLAIVDESGQPVSTTETIRFDSPCLRNDFSTINTGLLAQSNQGRISATYTAGENCNELSDVITATLVQPGRPVSETASVALDIGAAPAADERFITFVAADPVNIALRGTGGGSTLEERSQVTFEVRDGAGNPVVGQRVEFALSATTGGIELADVSSTTDADGRVKATVFAGVIPTPVRVIASTERRPAADADTDPGNDADAVSVVSDQLSISSGIVTQARFSIAASVLNVPGAAVLNGVTTDITASAFDRFGNPVPDGTSVNFTSECGGIGGSGPTGACQTAAGFCTVTWFSQPGGLKACPDNRVTILAHAQGEEAFTDVDANGFYSTLLDLPLEENEPFVDNQEAWRDDNESGDYNTPELFIDVDTGAGDTPPLNGEHDDRTPPAPADVALFNGLACLDETETYCKKALVSVFDTLELIAGTDDAATLTAGLYTTEGVLLDPATDPVTAGTYILRLSDDTGEIVNFPPFGTTISTATGGECEVVSPGLIVGNSSADTFFQFPVTIRTETDDPTTDDFVEITWVIPVVNSNPAQLVFNCNP